MCGIAGIIERSNDRGGGTICNAINGMSAALVHRGPDDGGAWVDEASGIALGFRRLAILDLSATGHQPMLSRAGGLVLIFNGEIYNHSELREQLTQCGHEWRGHSDTETLLACFAEWGVPTTLQRTVGMFSLALWDGGERRLHLARDRFGEKPLYYGWTRGAFVFGSEIKALRRYPGFDNPIDRDVLALYLHYCSVPAPYSIYKHIYKLEPGCILSMSPDAAATVAPAALFAPLQRGGLTLDRYWSLRGAMESGLASPLTDEREAIDRLESALARAVQLQSIADVPLGAFLSGGIDSSMIVALMQARSTRPVKTFTIGFEEAGFNEASHAKAVAAHLGTDHTELYVSAQKARDVIPLLPDMYSEPFADSSQIPTHLVSQITRRHVTVALSGDGGDELFGGYTRYVWAPRIWNRVKWLPMPLRRGLGRTINHVSLSDWDRLGQALTGGRLIERPGDKAHKLAHRLRHVNNVDDLYRTLVATWFADSNVVPGARPLPTVLGSALAGPAPEDAEHRMMFWDALTYLPDDILHKVDRASMAVSLETRAPFLDHRVAELAWRLPLRMKIRNGTSKWILRQVLDRYVPAALVDRPKMGFGVPIDTWLRGPLRPWAEDLLSEATLTSDGNLDPTPIRRLWVEHLSGQRNWQHELWAVLMYQAWRG